MGILAGVVAALAALSWPTAVVTLVLGVYYYIEHVMNRRNLALQCFLGAILGAAVILGLYVVCFRQHLDRMWSVITALVQSQQHDRQGVCPTIISCCQVVASSYRKSPWVLLWVLAATGLAIRRKANLGLLFLLAVTFVPIALATTFYHYRLLYFVPLVYLFVARTFSIIPARKRTIEPVERTANPSRETPTRYKDRSCRHNPGTCKALLVLLVVPSMAVNLGLRTGIAIAERQRRDYHEYSDQLTRLIPPNAITVGTYDIYYVGLSRNWQMFPFDFFEHPDHAPASFYLMIGKDCDIPERAEPFRPVYIGTAEVGGRQLASSGAWGYRTRVYHCSRAQPK